MFFGRILSALWPMMECRLRPPEGGTPTRRLREEAADETVLQTIGDPDDLYARRLTEVETITIKDPPPSLHLIGVA